MLRADNRMMRHGRNAQQRSVRVRLLIWLLMLPGAALLGLWLDLQWFRDWLFSPWFHLLTLVPGLVLMTLVFMVSRNTGRTLARYGREGDLPRLETNRLVRTGPYACMRHPMHLGLLFLPVALALIVGSVSFIVFIAPAEILFMLVRVLTLEEYEAVAKFGAAYLRYREEVPAFSLKPACLKALFETQQPATTTDEETRSG